MIDGKCYMNCGHRDLHDPCADQLKRAEMQLELDASRSKIKALADANNRHETDAAKMRRDLAHANLMTEAAREANKRLVAERDELKGSDVLAVERKMRLVTATQAIDQLSELAQKRGKLLDQAVADRDDAVAERESSDRVASQRLARVYEVEAHRDELNEENDRLGERCAAAEASVATASLSMFTESDNMKLRDTVEAQVERINTIIGERDEAQRQRDKSTKGWQDSWANNWQLKREAEKLRAQAERLRTLLDQTVANRDMWRKRAGEADDRKATPEANARMQKQFQEADDRKACRDRGWCNEPDHAAGCPAYKWDMEPPITRRADAMIAERKGWVDDS